jgi:hypothetical protein
VNRGCCSTRPSIHLLAPILLIFVLAPGLRAADNPSQPGAYCPFPEQGQKPVCFTRVEEEYGDFIDAVDSGRVDDPKVAELERTLQQAGSAEDRGLALSSLAYGYFMLAERAAAAEHPDPVLVARLESWNALLGTVYQDTESEATRNAVRRAARDLDERAPAVATECTAGADGESCKTTGRLQWTLRQIDDPDGESGVRGALGKLLGRVLDDDESADAADAE